EQGRLAGAVGAEQTEDGAARHLKAGAPKGLRPTASEPSASECLEEVARFDREHNPSIVTRRCRHPARARRGYGLGLVLRQVASQTRRGPQPEAYSLYVERLRAIEQRSMATQIAGARSSLLHARRI